MCVCVCVFDEIFLRSSSSPSSPSSPSSFLYTSFFATHQHHTCITGQHWLTIDLQQSQPVKGLRIWNYNKSVEDSARGARIVHAFLDDREISPPQVCYFVDP